MLSCHLDEDDDGERINRLLKQVVVRACAATVH